MRLLFIRHGDPDYTIDSVTEKGRREVQCLANYLENVQIDYAYVSPLGRAKATAAPTLERKKLQATEYDWLQEFPCRIERPDMPDKLNITWDWLPEDWLSDPRYLDKDKWYTTEIMKAGGVDKEYARVIKAFDELLAKHGYERNEKGCYNAVNPNRDTLAFFCHFGLECVLISHLMQISPMILWHNMCAAPTSITTVYTEERREGIASFRVNSFGDISHLYAQNEPPAFAARFCETYDCMEERHD